MNQREQLITAEKESKTAAEQPAASTFAANQANEGGGGGGAQTKSRKYIDRALFSAHLSHS